MADATPFRGAPARRNGEAFSISLSRSDALDVRTRIRELQLKGPSEFFQRLISEARGARLPILFSERKAS